MKVGFRLPLYRRLQSALGRMQAKTVHLVHDNAQWSFYWDACYLTRGLKERLGVRAGMTVSPWRLRGQIIHFVDRYAYLLKNQSKGLHASNRVFLTWYHGDPSDPNPDMRLLFPALERAADKLEKIVVPCRITKQGLTEFGISVSKLETIPLGVDLVRFTPATPEMKAQVRAALGIPNRAICIGLFQKDGVGWGDGMDPKLIKGPDVFLEVMSEMVSRYRHLSVLLTGPARGYVKRGLDKLRVPYLHRYLAEYHEIVAYYRAVDLYIIPSRCEGGPKALLESWATGVPVVSTRIGMPADLIRHGVNGMLSDSEDVRALAQNACEVIDNTPLRRTCIEQALLDCREYDWNRIAEQHYRKLYKPCLT